MAIFEKNKVKIFFETYGNGQPLVLIPGFASGAWTWFRQIKELSESFRLITFDPHGIAKSSSESSLPISIQSIADDIANLLDELKIEKANVLGASFGGFVAQEFALKYPERLNKLILACTSFGGINHVAPSIEVLTAFASTTGLNTLAGVRKYMIPAFTAEFIKNQPDEVENVCNLREQNLVPESVYFQQLQSATTFDTENRVANIKVETLILTGDKDVVVPMQNSKNLADKIPNSTLKIIENGGHLFFIEKAKEFNQIVTNFI